MFTGLVQSLGRVVAITPLGSGCEVVVSCDSEFSKDHVIGDSISLNGVCSTVVECKKGQFRVQYLEETLKKTTMGCLTVDDVINLEHCCLPTTKLGGHIVSGHVDDTGTILSFDFDGQWAVLTVSFQKKFAPFLIEKGSIAIDGISLTIVDVFSDRFTCHLIPHTIEQTVLHQKKVTDLVNLEFDQIGKYLYRFYQLDRLV